MATAPVLTTDTWRMGSKLTCTPPLRTPSSRRAGRSAGCGEALGSSPRATAQTCPVQPANWTGQVASVDAFDDAEVALDAVGESDQRLVVGRTLACRDGLLEAVELDQDGALGDSGVVRGDPTVTDDGPTAASLDGHRGQLVVSSQLLRV